jgi:hypothetical protein
MVDWKITKRQAACTPCERTFTDGEQHFSALLLRDEQLTREDVCSACWRRRSAGSELFWWRTRHDAGRQRGFALNLEALEALFVQLEGRTEAALRELRYVLCLILMRKRRLKLERIFRDESGEGMVVRRPRRDESFVVAVFDFQPERIDELSARLREVFDGAEGEPSSSAQPSDAAGPSVANA